MTNKSPRGLATHLSIAINIFDAIVPSAPPPPPPSPPEGYISLLIYFWSLPLDCLPCSVEIQPIVLKMMMKICFPPLDPLP